MKLKTLKDVLGNLPHELLCGDYGSEVSELAYDSRECSPGSLFFCIRGFSTDGHNYIAEAIARGAGALVVEEFSGAADDAAIVKVADSRQAMALMAANFYDHPSQKLNLVGITGTNGKTSVATITDALLRRLGHTAGLLGTVTNRIGGEELKLKRTTPESLDLQALLARMIEKGCTHAVMEVSSHAVALNRIAGCRYNAGILTNVTQDHLDFHKDFDDYLETKKRFFAESIDPDGVIILNRDDANYEKMRAGLPGRIVTYGIKESGADVRAVDVAFDHRGISFTVQSAFADSFRLETGLLGLFNVANALAVVAYALSQNIPVDALRETFAAMPCVPGRFERVEAGQPFTVIVDYAHTPDGLENVLSSAREICRGRLIAIFGAGGDRDRSKRPLMGHAAARLSDFVIVTSDNPRTEAPYRIIEQIVYGIEQELEKVAPSKRFKYLIEEDRYTAIRTAIMSAREDDVIVIAGKGHEDYQIFKDRTIHFDDRVVARKILEERQSSGTDNAE
jgi:UDP-N-acetylmuramoyl-L-alanyl-D-glutamate--2,6-diaminopimelate ligase